MQFNINQAYASTLDSLDLVNQLKLKTSLTKEEADRLHANVEHLKIMLCKPFWTTQDLSAWFAATGMTADDVAAKRADATARQVG